MAFWNVNLYLENFLWEPFIQLCGQQIRSLSTEIRGCLHTAVRHNVPNFSKDWPDILVSLKSRSCYIFFSCQRKYLNRLKLKNIAVNRENDKSRFSAIVAPQFFTLFKDGKVSLCVKTKFVKFAKFDADPKRSSKFTAAKRFFTILLSDRLQKMSFYKSPNPV